jgi:lysyl-tRNA synthetase, class I
MHWADKIAQDIINTGKYQPYWVDDMKTPSGRIHVGSLRGVLIHDIVAVALRDQGQAATYTYVFNDMDPMDGLPGYLDQAVYQQYMGVPVWKIPAPDGQSENFAVQYANDFIDVITQLGATPKIIWSHELYESGQMNQVIKEALDGAGKIREIYSRVAKQNRPDTWYPFQVICPQCGKLGTSNVTGWNGDTVHYHCQPDLVTWAEGCGHQGDISPFNGTGKLMWKIDWPAHWKVIGITIEGAGKDHTSEGGSRDIAKEVSRHVFNYSEPYDIPYEWFLIGGKKMSSSKGVGTSAREFSQILPPTIGRFLFVKTKYSRHLNFDPTGMTIPDLYDDYDQMAEEYWSGQKTEYARNFELAQIGPVPKRHFLPRFRTVAQVIQDPKRDPATEFAAIKGSPLSDHELAVLKERIEFARIWLKDYAPDNMIFRVNQADPVVLSDPQKTYLRSIVPLIQAASDPDQLQQELYQTAKDQPLPPKAAFAAIYQLLIGKNHGPKAAWLLLENKQAALDKIGRLDQNGSGEAPADIPSVHSDHIRLDPVFKETYPSAVIGYALVQDITVKPLDQELEAERQQFAAEQAGLTTEHINTYPEIKSYRKMYKDMGVDWHSRRPSPEALLRRLATGKGLYPPINTCVDAYNLVVMKQRISVGAFDADKLTTPIEVKIAKGGESALYIGDKDEPTVLKAGEVAYFDQEGPYNLDYNYRDALRAVVTENTKNIWINTEGIYDINASQVKETLEATLKLIQKYCGGTVVEQGIIKAL